jgi:glycerol-3-phosphate dehydrogenase
LVADTSVALGPDARRRALERFATETFDVLVIGGGVTGCGVALDAASRGLSVALVEKRDFAAGTSSRSSKLIHGGLRYLENLDLVLVREALHERRLLLKKTAPHLVHATPFLFPLKHRAWDRFYMGAGLFIYDALAGLHSAVPRHRHLSKASCLRHVPALRDGALCGGIRYYDAQMDDSRFVVALVRTALSHGAVAAAGVRAVDMLRDGDRVTGARVHDTESGRELDIRARVVVNASGVWTTEVEHLAGVANPALAVRPSKGIHLVVPRDRIDSDYALILPTAKSVLFVLPWAGHWIIGTTDTDWHYDLDHPAANRADIEYLLDQINPVLARPLTRADIVGVYAGLRPLVSAGGKDTTKVSRNHQVRRDAPGFVSVAGGKYTTYRIMARDAVDAAAHELPFAVEASRTADLPLLGAVGFSVARSRAAAHPGAAGLERAQLDRLVSRWGSLALEVLDVIAADPALGEPVPGADEYLCAEISYATSHEGALHVDDVLTRRTHISFEVPDRGAEAVATVARLMAAVLDWDEATAEREIAHYRARLAAELEAETMPDDAASDAVRSVVRDLRLDPSDDGPTTSPVHTAVR